MSEEPSARAAAAVIRAWIEPGAHGLRVRVTETLDLAEPATRVNAVVSSIDEACDIVRRWLTRVVDASAGQTGTVASRHGRPEGRGDPER